MAPQVIILHTFFAPFFLSGEENEICFWVNLILPSSLSLSQTLYKGSWEEQQKEYIALLCQTTQGNSFFSVTFTTDSFFFVSVYVCMCVCVKNMVMIKGECEPYFLHCMCAQQSLKSLLLFVDFVKFHCLPSFPNTSLSLRGMAWHRTA